VQLQEGRGEGLPVGAQTLVRSAEMRYKGQSFEINVPLPAGPITDLAPVLSAFHAAYEQIYGYVDLNYQKIFETQFLEAFNVTRAGGDHPLFNQMLMGLTLPGAQVAALPRLRLFIAVGLG